MLYAYLKIPGIANSESTDQFYGKEWIPLKSIKLSGENNADDSVYQSAADYLERKKEARRKERKRLATAGKSETSKTAALDSPVETTILNASESPPPPPPPPPPTFSFHSDDDLFKSDISGDFDSQRDAGGSITVTKMLDSTSPKLHLVCLKSLQCESDEYIKGKIEIHICRQIADPNVKGESSIQIYMGYIMENCLITNLGLDASENEKLTETITISFEKISACIRLDGKNWDSQGWDFIEEKSVTPTVPLRPTPKK